MIAELGLTFAISKTFWKITAKGIAVILTKYLIAIAVLCIGIADNPGSSNVTRNSCFEH